MKNKYLLYLGLLGVLTPLSLLFWIWRVVNVEALTALIPQPVKFFTFLGGILISAAFAGATIYFMLKSRAQCVHCGSEMEEQIVHADKLSTVGQLAGGVAHEVNTPASIITGRVETMLLDSKHFTNRDFQDLEVIKKQAERISEITKGLLLFAKRSPADKVRVDLNDIVGESLVLISTQLEKARIKIARDLSPKPVLVWAQHNQLIQVMLNLLTNARDAMPDGGQVEIKTLAHNGHKQVGVLQVCDSGVGIPQEDVRRIFEPFFTTKKNGTGLGLSVSYGIIQEHGGNIQVRSQLGEGTTFSIYIPLLTQSIGLS